MISSSLTLIHDFLENSARDYPDKVALIHDGLRATYADINNQANNLASYLINRGVSPGDRVVFLFENCLEYVISYYAALKTGAVAVPLNSDLKPEGLNPIVRELEPKAIISSSRFERLLEVSQLNDCGLESLILKSPALSWLRSGITVEKLDDILQQGSLSNPNVDIRETDLASIIYTSGSTGRPKGVMLTHGNIVSNTLSICDYLRLTPYDIQMVVLPFFYVMGKSLLNTHFAAGATVVINNKFAFTATVLNEMVAENVTGFSGVPSTYAYLLHRSPLAAYRDKLSGLRYCSQAGGHMSRSIKEELRQVLPAHTDIYIMYGATEASARLAYLEPGLYSQKMDSIGKAIPGVTLKILDPSGAELKPGETGELVATGPNIMRSYWKDQASTARALSGGWYHTGDQAYEDANGHFFVVGRIDDQLKVGGHRVNPLEIEDTIMESGMLVETVVLGIADDLLGHKLVACSVPKSNDCDEKCILAYCAEKLPKYKIPSAVVLVRALPKNSSGKIDRLKCSELLKEDLISVELKASVKC